MKKLITYTVCVLTIVATALSCRDESKIVYDTSKLPQGAYGRLILPIPTNVDSAAFAKASFTFNVEVVGSPATGIQSYTIDVAYKNAKGEVIKKTTQPVASITTWQVYSTTQLPRGQATITGTAILAALSMTPADLKSANQFVFLTSLNLTDGRKYNASNVSSNLSLPFYNSPYSWTTTIGFDLAPTLTWHHSNPIKGGSQDTLNIVFSSAIATLPVVSVSPAYATLSPVVLNAKNDKNTKTNYYTILAANSSNTGTVTVSGAVATDNDRVATTTITRAIDNQPPGAYQSWTVSPIGRGQFTVLKLMFTERMASAPLATITGNNLNPVTNAPMTLSGDGLSATLKYGYNNTNTPDNTTSGNMMLVLTSNSKAGTDLAGNPLATTPLSSSNLAIDVATPELPVITPSTPYDWGNELEITAAVSGYSRGTINFIAVTHGTGAPAQATTSVQGLTINAGFNISALSSSNIALIGNFNLASGPLFIPFVPNGTFDLYFYYVSPTNNISANTTSPVTITMK